MMVFDVVCARREGRSIPRWALGAATVHRGTLILDEINNDTPIAHTCRVLRMNPVNAYDKPTLLPLWNPVIVYASGDWIVFDGTEKSDDFTGNRDYMQTWICT